MRNVIYFLFLFLSINTSAQKLSTDNPYINDAFELAIRTIDINTRRGILAAGADYGGEWTRDISINSWNGTSLFRPEIAERSLWSVTINKDTIGHQYWDKIIWVIAAYNHYLVTGDKVFLQQAYKCSANTMAQLEKQTFDVEYGLFNGPSVFNDGIAAYPEPVYEPLNYSSSVLDHKNSAYIKCLSTNCIYYGAYSALYKMEQLFGVGNSIHSYRQKSERLKENILKCFYDSDSNTFSYLIDQNGKVFKAQEGLGISFAVVFGIAAPNKVNQLIGNAVVSKYGITSIYPDFPRNSAQKPGRHNNIIWPMVNGFFARAAVAAKNYSKFTSELYSLTHLALDQDKGDYDFREVYNPYSGKPDGGWQANGVSMPDFHWDSCKLQTWSATAYVSMVLNGLMGIRFDDGGIRFEPYLPKGIKQVKLTDLNYRNAVLNISIRGNGSSIKTFTVNGKLKQDHVISSDLTGKQDIVIELY